jgi:iron complex outermembrane receptor protein
MTTISTSVRHRLVPLFLAWALACALLAPATLAEEAAPADTTPPAATPPSSEETVVVTAKRLPDGDAPRNEVPAHVTILTREDIERSGARTLQDVLALEAGVLVYDQVGNDVQKTLDLRGFASGSGTAVFVDGARINDPRNNGVSLEMVPIDAVERIEITRGSASALAGGGSEGGVVHILTRKAEKTTGSLEAAYGTDETLRAVGTIGGKAGPVDFFVSGAYDETAGFRENADGSQERFTATAGYDFEGGRRMFLTLSSSDLDYGNPGALTEEELAADAEASPFNSLDRTESSARQAALHYQGAIAGSFSLAANLYLLDRDAESLTTGRAAPAFGGFFLDSEGSSYGSTVQVRYDGRLGSLENDLAFGVEWLHGETDSLGFSTPSSDLDAVDRDNPSSDNTTTRETTAFFVQDTLKPTHRLALSLGARRDDDEIAYDERIPDPTIAGSRSFSETSLRGGATFRVSDPVSLFISYGEAFLAPTVEDLFAFPGFGSNPDLEPEDSRTYEFGARADFAKTHLELAVFRIDVENEIVFDPTPLPTDPFGRNVNAGETRREGAELTARSHLASNLDGFATVTHMDATFQNGEAEGNRVPLVPELRASGGFDLRLPRGFGVSADVLYVGSQVLDNDALNTQDELGAYAAVNARARYRFRTSRGHEIGGFVEARNLLDREYATRGIYAFDFGTFSNAVFVTPAPGRRFFAGIEWKL